jgi:hypothetical protein
VVFHGSEQRKRLERVIPRQTDGMNMSIIGTVVACVVKSSGVAETLMIKKRI